MGITNRLNNMVVKVKWFVGTISPPRIVPPVLEEVDLANFKCARRFLVEAENIFYRDVNWKIFCRVLDTSPDDLCRQLSIYYLSACT
jgi:hypothetical protein